MSRLFRDQPNLYLRHDDGTQHHLQDRQPGTFRSYGLYSSGWWDIDMGLRRTFNVRETATLHLTFQFEADVTNATNSTFFNTGSTNWDASGFGVVSGQNQQIPPRDWQFAGRFRF